MDTLLWLEPTGEAHLLTGNGTVNVLADVRGLYAAPAELITDTVPLVAGTRLRGVRTAAREVDVTLFVQASDEAGLRLLLRDVARWLDPTRGDGRLRVVPPAGATRDLICRVPRGLGFDPEQGRTYWGTSTGPAAEVPITFYAPDPYYVAATPIVSNYSVSVPSGIGFPYPPVVLAGSSVVSLTTEYNPGDVPAQPIWTITGPASSVTLINQTTGAIFGLGRNLVAGDTVVIDTREQHRTVTLLTPNDMYPEIVPGSSLWWFNPGANSVTVDMPNTSITSTVSVSYSPRFRTI